MTFKQFFLLFSMFLSIQLNAEESPKERAHIEVALRMIGHQVMLAFGDSTSRVLPIQKIGAQYKIEFANNFQFNSDRLIQSIDSIVVSTQLASKYIVEVKECLSNAVVYSYEIGVLEETSITPCKSRSQENACYYLLFSILDTPDLIELSSNENSTILWLILGLIFLVSISLFLFFKRGKPVQLDEDTVLIGAYQFNKREMALLYNNETTALSSKETDLLYLLYSAANTTLERSEILNRVWGDEGDYVGRTLDVFISKLRKKLENDQSIRITNIRGIGYKLIMQENH